MKPKATIIQFLIFGLLMISFITACSPHIARNIQKYYPALANSAEVKVIKIDESIPFSYEELGTVTLGDAGLTGKSKCTYEALLALAREEAKRVGGDAIKITESIPPGWIRSGVTRSGVMVGVGVGYQLCHTLSVKILKEIKETD